MTKKNQTTDKVKELLKQEKKLTEICLILNMRPASVHYQITKIKNESKVSNRNWNEIKDYFDQGNDRMSCMAKYDIHYSEWENAIKNNLLPPECLQKHLELKSWLINGIDIPSSRLKKKILEENLLKNECVECGQPPEWNFKPLNLQLDHINGNPKDNRIENLRILCPHCHSQTPTYCKGFKYKKTETFCIDCKISISYRSTRCRKCSRKKIYEKTNYDILPKETEELPKKEKSKLGLRPRKFSISKEELAELVWRKPTTEIAKMFGVSDKAIEKRCRKLGIEKPPRGYWAKQASINKK